MNYDLIVIGGGPAGYVGAIRAAQLGRRVLCVERERAGGTCLNWGCIPTKALLRSAELYQVLDKQAAEFGFKVDGLGFDWERVIARSRAVSDKNAAGIEFLFKKNKVDYIVGEASLENATTVKVGEETHSSGKILLATGCVSRSLPGLVFNGKTVIGSREAMVLPARPDSMVIIGGGAIGVEFAYFFNAFGTKVTLVEALPNLLPYEDVDISQVIERAYKKQGITVLTGTKPERLEATDTGVRVDDLEADVALVAIGVKPVLPGGAMQPDLTEKGYLKVNERYETSVPGVFAAGDVIGPPWLAHVASFQAVEAVEGMFAAGHVPRRIPHFPACTYSHPQVASVGLLEREAKERGIAYKLGKFPFMASGKARAVGETDGFVKVLIGEPDGEILGAHIVGPDAPEMIAELGLAMTLEATWQEIEATIHAHPTLSEAVHEAVGQAMGRAIHL